MTCFTNSCKLLACGLLIGRYSTIPISTLRGFAYCVYFFRII
ncbi:Uncharacterised protein [Vibrio cholerae]|nr:Uncharacterised protein [Vibrio cholerae]CSI86245.1 Uncharacterised protein [Vibrio cholerae]